MLRGSHPILLILAWALPTTAGALGLGEIHVDSSLNERLSAQIDIVGASLEDLTDLRATVGTLEIFQRYGAERPAYLNSATFKVGQDAQGRPVLEVRSRDSFTDPLLSLLVDLKWRNNELVREYSLLLDPFGLAAARRAADIAPVAKALTAQERTPHERATVAPPADVVRVPQSAPGALHRITSRDTLRAIVRHAGARTESQIQRMMMATFRANPAAFDGNINRLHRGIVLDIPSSAAVDAITVDDAKRLVDAQMAAWRTVGHVVAARPAAAPAVTDTLHEHNDGVLTSRLQSLEQQLGDLHQQMAIEHADMEQLRLTAARVTASPSAALETLNTSPVAQPRGHGTLLLVLAGLLLAAALAVYRYLRRRLQQPVSKPDTAVALPPTMPESIATAVSEAIAMPSPITRPTVPAVTPQWPPTVAKDQSRGMSVEVDTEALERSYLESLGFNSATPGQDAAATGQFDFAGTSTVTSDTATLESIAPPGPVAETAEIDMSDLEESEMDATELATAVINVDATTLVVSVPQPLVAPPEMDPAASVTTELDFNLSNLDATAEHVQMPSALNDRAESSEGRTNIVDVLKMAIDRDPHRRDLRMKLLETYYNAATGNRRAFMDVVRKLARERQDLTAEEWNKIVRMGRDLAPEDILFTDLVKNKDDLAA